MISELLRCYSQEPLDAYATVGRLEFEAHNADARELLDYLREAYGFSLDGIQHPHRPDEANDMRGRCDSGTHHTGTGSSVFSSTSSLDLRAVRRHRSCGALGDVLRLPVARRSGQTKTCGAVLSSAERSIGAAMRRQGSFDSSRSTLPSAKLSSLLPASIEEAGLPECASPHRSSSSSWGLRPGKRSSRTQACGAELASAQRSPAMNASRLEDSRSSTFDSAKGSPPDSWHSATSSPRGHPHMEPVKEPLSPFSVAGQSRRPSGTASQGPAEEPEPRLASELRSGSGPALRQGRCSLFGSSRRLWPAQVAGGPAWGYGSAAARPAAAEAAPGGAPAVPAAADSIRSLFARASRRLGRTRTRDF